MVDVAVLWSTPDPQPPTEYYSKLSKYHHQRLERFLSASILSGFSLWMGSLDLLLLDLPGDGGLRLVQGSAGLSGARDGGVWQSRFLELPPLPHWLEQQHGEL